MWDFGDASSSTLQSPQHTYAANGTYIVCLVAADCDADTVCTQITTCPEVLTASFTSTDSALTASFVSTSNGALTYHWDFGDGNFSSGQNPIHFYANTGLYTVCLTTWNVCGDSAVSCDTVLIVITNDQIQAAGVSVQLYPNPMSNETSVSTTSTLYSGAFVFEMYDAAGKLVRTQNGTFNQPMTVLRGDLADGLYIYKIKQNNEVISNGNLMMTK
jgi:hypothetical protein